MRRNSYPTDVTDSQWKVLERRIPAAKAGGRPAEYSRREIVNGILYRIRQGCTWRALPHDLPPYRLWQKAASPDGKPSRRPEQHATGWLPIRKQILCFS